MNTCVISGGGPKGSFAVGVLCALEERGLRIDRYYGTSTGALISPFARLGKLDFLKQTYLTVTPKEIYGKRKWWQLPFSPGLYNMDPMRSIIEANLSEEEFLKLDGVCVTTYNLNAGRIRYWQPEDCTREEFIDAMIASASIPIVSDPVTIQGDRHVDGGVRDIAPLRFINSEDKVLIISMGSPMERKENIRGVHEIAQRVLDGMTAEILENDLESTRRLEGYSITHMGRFCHIKLDVAYVKGQNWTLEDMQRQYSHGFQKGMVANLEIFGL